MTAQKSTLLKEIRESAVIAIIRGVDGARLPELTEALCRGGIRFAEITFDQTEKTPNKETAAMIGALRKQLSGRMHIGAGTVMTVQQAELAMEAGAEFLISPNVCREVIRRTVDAECVSIPGALTPTEIAEAYEAGADFVKVFPVDALGIPYLKAITAPLSHIPMLAVGGVNDENLAEYLSAGLCGVGVGSALTPKQWIAEGKFEEIAKLASRYREAVCRFRNAQETRK